MTENMNTIPEIDKTAFICPHCNAYTTQHWSYLYSKPYPEDSRTPNSLNHSLHNISSGRIKEKLFIKQNAGKPSIIVLDKEEGSDQLLKNLYISQCYNCKEIAIWVDDRLVWPSSKIEIQPNQDLSSEIRSLFEEAREIVASSPKGAAALLRLSIQHLCKELGESGKDLNQDIANLVKKGLDPVIQQALDVVRVIGNEAVHPGKIELNDNRDIALQLFNLVNFIADQMISRPKQVQVLYNKIPKDKLKGIEERDRNAKR